MPGKKWDDDVKKLSFTLNALQQPDPFQGGVELERDILCAVEWMSARSAKEVLLGYCSMCLLGYAFVSAGHCIQGESHMRLGSGSGSAVVLPSFLSRSGHDPVACRSSGECRAWLSDTDEHVKEVSAAVCGPLLEKLAAETGHSDPDCVELFRTGCHCA